MTQNHANFNEGLTIAPLTNVALCLGGMERALHRSEHLPGLVVLSGPSGYGKSTAAIYAANKYRAYRVEAKDSWNRKAFLENVLKEMGIPPASTIYAMLDQVCGQLDASGRPLIVDETDNIVARGYIETVRDIHDGCRTSILMIGEEKLPLKLKRWERVHGRILDFVLAQPADISDAQHLRKLYCTQVAIADDLLEHIQRASKGSARRICVNLERMQEEAVSRGMSEFTLPDARGLELFTGEPPKRRD